MVKTSKNVKVAHGNKREINKRAKLWGQIASVANVHVQFKGHDKPINRLLVKARKANETRGSQKVTKKRSIAMGTFKNPGGFGAYSNAPFRGVQVPGTGVPQGPAK